MLKGGSRWSKPTDLCYMKKVTILLLALAACKADSRTFINHSEGRYSIADDTLIFRNNFIIKRTGFQKIRDGRRLPKQYKVRQWKPGGPDAPAVRFDGKHAYLNNTIYVLLP